MQSNRVVRSYQETTAMTTIAAGTCFLDHNSAVFLVTNWDRRRNPDDPAVLIKLSPRHSAIYRALHAKQRSQKSIYFALFARGAARHGPGTTPVSINLTNLTTTQLTRIAHSKLRYPVPSLGRLPHAELRSLVCSLYQLAW